LPVSLALSFVIPLITFTTVKYIEPVNFDTNSFAYLAPATGEIVQPAFVFEWYHYLFGLYLLGTAGFLFHLLLGHLKAIKIIQKSRIQKIFGSTLNITKKEVHPFSFFSKIVVSEKTLFHPDLEIIVSHENIHVREKHTLDILFTEIMFLFQWFNPFAWLLKDAVKNNLEYLADHEIAKHYNPQTYQLAMVTLADKQGIAPFLTALNGSQLKNRIVMMKKKKENKYALVKQLVVLPLLAVLVMGLSNKEMKTEVLQSNSEITKENTFQKPEMNYLHQSDTTSKKDEVKVIGYGNSEKKESKGSGYTISGGLNGTVAKGSDNFTITPSSKNGITIKATGDQAGQPLYVVDGVVTKNINQVQPENIERIDVLKDKSATSIYGDKGKNGVILISTKSKEKQGEQNTFGNEEVSELRMPVAGDSLNLKMPTAVADQQFQYYIKEKQIDYVNPLEKNSKIQPLILINGKESGQSLNNIDPATIESVYVLKDKRATKKYGEKGKHGVILINTKTKYNSETEIKLEKQTIFDLRKKIAQSVKYPVVAKENDQQGVVDIWAVIEKDGTISNISDKRLEGKIINIDEVVVTALKSEKAVTSEKSKDLALLVKESKRVIEQLSPLKIPELAGETVSFRIKFVLE